jgi:flagellar protein FlbD
MIHLTRLNHVPLVVNSDLIEHIEVTPDTVIVLTTGQKFLVLETADEVIERVVKFRRTLLDGVSAYQVKSGARHLPAGSQETQQPNEC